MSSIFDLNSGSSDSEDDVDYVPSNNIDSDDANESPDEESETEEPPSKKTKEIENKVEPIVNKSADEAWASFLKGVTNAYVPDRNQTEASTSDKADPTKVVDKVECTDAEKKVEDKGFDCDEKKLSAGGVLVLNKDENVGGASCIDIVPNSSAVQESKVFQAQNNAKKETATHVLVNRPRTGLSSILGTIGSKGKKQSVLEKSLADWKSFKEQEGIGKDLETYNKGRSGYIERKRFLERSDIRSFENEKNLRLLGRKKK